MRKTILSLSFILAILLVFSIGFWLYERQTVTGRATFVEKEASIENSYLFISPLRAQANGEDKIRLTVFVLNGKGLGLVGKRVEIEQDPSLKMSWIQALSDEYGRAVFDISSDKPGEYYLSLKVDGKEFDREAHLSFFK